jgi:proline iminopeptidase
MKKGLLAALFLTLCSIGSSRESPQPGQGFIDVPVLFIAGQFDEARPERVAEFQKLIPGSKLTIILDAAHSTLSRKPDEYRNVLESFLDSVEEMKQ